MTRWLNTLYENTLEILSNLEFKNLNEKEVSEKMRSLNLVYDLMKIKHHWQFRKSWERYFEHLRRTTKIYLNELENPTFNWVMISLLHDCLEDTNITFDILNNLFWKYIARSVLLLTKEEDIVSDYYYWNLSYCDIIQIKVKIADRIDNLRTIGCCNNIKHKIEQTKKYIIPLAEKYTNFWLVLLKLEIQNLEKKYTWF